MIKDIKKLLANSDISGVSFYIDQKKLGVYPVEAAYMILELSESDFFIRCTYSGPGRKIKVRVNRKL